MQVKAVGVPDSFLQLTLHFLPKLGIVTVRNSLGGEAKLTGEVRAPMYYPPKQGNVAKISVFV